MGKFALKIAVDRRDSKMIGHAAFRNLLAVKWELCKWHASHLLFDPCLTTFHNPDAQKVYLFGFFWNLAIMVSLSIAIGTLPDDINVRRDFGRGGEHTHSRNSETFLFCGTVVLIVKEVFDMKRQGMTYIWGYGKWENLMQWVFAALLVVFMAMRFIYDDGDLELLLMGVAAIWGWIYFLSLMKGYRVVYSPFPSFFDITCLIPF